MGGMLIAFYLSLRQPREYPWNILVQLDIGFDIEGVDEKRCDGIVEGNRRPENESQKPFQESVFRQRDHTAGNSVMMRSMEIYELQFGIVAQPMVAIEPGV